MFLPTPCFASSGCKRVVFKWRCKLLFVHDNFNMLLSLHFIKWSGNINFTTGGCKDCFPILIFELISVFLSVHFLFSDLKDLWIRNGFWYACNGIRVFRNLRHPIIHVPDKILPVPLSVPLSPICPPLKTRSNLVGQTNHLKVENGKIS